VVHGAADVGVLAMTGVRDKAPVAALLYPVPNSKLLEVYVQASEQTQQSRKGYNNKGISLARDKTIKLAKPHQEALSYLPSVMFNNEMHENEPARNFFRKQPATLGSRRLTATC